MTQLVPHCPNLSALWIGSMSNTENRDFLVSIIPRLTQLNTLRYEGLRSDAADCAAVAAVMSLTRLEWIRLECVSLGDDGVEGTDAMTRLRTVVFGGIVGVHMTAEAWDRLLTSLLTLPQSVSVRLDRTNIDGETVERIQTSPRVTVTRDHGRGEDGRHYKMLEFTTSPSPT